MQPEEMQALWASHDVRLERVIELNDRLLRETVLTKARPVLSRQVFSAAATLASALLLMILTGWFLVANLDSTPFVVTAAMLQVFWFGVAVGAGRQVALLRALDFGGTVSEIQRRIEAIELAAYRTTKWTLLWACLIWIPVPVVIAKAAFGFDSFAVLDPMWLAANFAFGVVVFGVLQWLAKHFVEGPGTTPWARRLVATMSGHRLAKVTGFFDELSHFERENS